MTGWRAGECRRGRHRRRQWTQRPGRRRHLRPGRAGGAGVRGPADARAAAPAAPPDPEFPGVLHDICSAVHPLAVASPFFAEFDLRGARGAACRAGGVLCQSAAGPARRGGVPLAGAHLRRARRRRVVATPLRTADRTRRRCARVLPRRQAFAATGSGDRGADRPAGVAPGQPGVGPAARRGRSRAVHRRWRTCHFDDALAGQQRRRADARHAWRTRRAGRCRSGGRR